MSEKFTGIITALMRGEKCNRIYWVIEIKLTNDWMKRLYVMTEIVEQVSDFWFACNKKQLYAFEAWYAAKPHGIFPVLSSIYPIHPILPGEDSVELARILDKYIISGKENGVLGKDIDPGLA